MKEKQMKSFVKVDYNLLATTKLSSTQKLFVSYIIGWQKNGKICFETNKTLALKFGMQYGGMRSVITTLNKFDFFKAIKKDYDERTGTSGHEITVSIDLLEKFLQPDEKPNEIVSTKAKSIEELNSEFYVTPTLKQDELKSIPTYQDSDIIDIEEIMNILNFKETDIREFKKEFRTAKVSFEDFQYYFCSIALTQNKEYHKGILISEEQKDRFNKMIANQ
ncbi:hypothetical protein SAMN05443543_103359 [Flavobacterium flevense]|uniref:Uncharacterized protein n=1 Tax=Flavobacterium flevense TaxID=983 RepID=A0A4Y4AVK9_9FLAO|nr:hypothetical protein [Flavobacterium flevense]GEC72246.1 hypothetical protein FFL01_17850 [Flavobacterium flevense]SHL67057.1 hypothetical protein SAMN05443543_103359 [Flavobacterium flevense]